MKVKRAPEATDLNWDEEFFGDLSEFYKTLPPAIIEENIIE